MFQSVLKPMCLLGMQSEQHLQALRHGSFMSTVPRIKHGLSGYQSVMVSRQQDSVWMILQHFRVVKCCKCASGYAVYPNIAVSISTSTGPVTAKYCILN